MHGAECGWKCGWSRSVDGVEVWMKQKYGWSSSVDGVEVWVE